MFKVSRKTSSSSALAVSAFSKVRTIACDRAADGPGGMAVDVGVEPASVSGPCAMIGETITVSDSETSPR